MSKVERVIALSIVALTILVGWTIVNAAFNYQAYESAPACGRYDYCQEAVQ